MANTGISTKLLKYFQENANRMVTIDELVESFPEYSRHALMNNVRNLSVTPAGTDIVRVKSGVWEFAWQTPEDDKKATFTILKETSTTYILESESGDLYRAEFIG